MRKGIAVVAAVGVFGLGACGSDEPGGQPICVNQETAEQISAEECRNGAPGAVWFYPSEDAPLEVEIDIDTKKASSAKTARGSYVKSGKR